MAKVHTIDLNFLGLPRAIATYLIPHRDGLILIESGPASTLAALQAGVQSQGFKFEEITDLLLTHIHLDHAGAAGWLAREGVRVHVHPRGAPHLVNPRRLLASASRIYGDDMDRLWGQILPVPEDSIRVVEDLQKIRIGGLSILALDTPGHANHHHAYFLDGVCFSGDIGGIRLPGTGHLELPFPPPEIELDRWLASLTRIEEQSPDTIAPTHFGFHDDVAWQIQAARERLQSAREWIESHMAENPPPDELQSRFSVRSMARRQANGLAEGELESIEAANPAWMSADGLRRYWTKHLSENS